MLGSGFTHINPILTDVVQWIQDRVDGIRLNEPNTLAHVQQRACSLEIYVVDSMSFSKDVAGVMCGSHGDVRPLAYDFALQTAGVRRLPVLILGKEHDKAEIGFRLLCLQGQLSPWKVAMGELDDDDWRNMSKALGVLHDAPLYVGVHDGLSINSTRCLVKDALKDAHVAGGVVIENLNRLTTSGGNASFYEELEAILVQLRLLSSDISAPVVGTMAYEHLTIKLSREQEQIIQQQDLHYLGDPSYSNLLQFFSKGANHGTKNRH